jgi:tape measure domain-containing protein
MAIEAGDIRVRLSADVSPFQRDLARAQQVAQQAAGRLRAALITGLSFAGGTAVLGVFQQALAAAADATVGFNASLEQTQVSFEVMLKSADRARQMMADLQRFAATTPFELPQLTEAARMLLNARFEMQQIIPVLTAIGDVSQGQADKIWRITLALTQMSSRGKVSGEELMQLTEAGVAVGAVMDIMAAKLGKSTQELQKLQEKGQLSARLFIEAFREMAARDFGGMMARQAQTFNGAVSTILDSVRQFGGTAFEPIFRRVREVAIRLADLGQSGGLEELARRTAGHVEVILRALGILASGYQRAMLAIARIVTSAAVVIFRALNYLNPFARHSPSLIDVMTEGYENRIPEIFANLVARTGPLLDAAAAQIERFKAVTAGGVARAEAAQRAETEQLVALLGGGAVDAYRAAQAAVEALGRELAAVNAQIREQEAVLAALNAGLRDLEAAQRAAQQRVSELSGELTRARDELNEWAGAIVAGTRAVEERLADLAQEARQVELAIVETKLTGGLERARARVEALRGALARARDQLQAFAAASLVGTRAYEEALFANDQAAKRLLLTINRLQAALSGEATSAALAENEDAIARIQLQINKLRLAGGGEDQVAALTAELERLRLVGETIRLQEAVDTAPLRRQLEQYQRQLARVQAEGERIRLTEALDLEPQRRALRQLLDDSRELTFEQARAGIVKWKAATDHLEGSLKRAEAVERARAGQLAALEQRLERLRLLSQQTRLRFEIDTDAFERARKRLLDRRLEAAAQTILDNVGRAVAKIGEIEPKLAEAQAAEQAAAKAVEAQRQRLQEQSQALADLRAKYGEIAERAQTWRQELDQILTAARQLAEAQQAGAGAGLGLGPEGGPGGAGETPIDQILRKADDWAKNDPFRQVLDEWEGRLQGLQTTIDGLAGPLERLADDLSTLAGTGKSLGEAWAALTKEAGTFGQTLRQEVSDVLQPFINVWNKDLRPALNALNEWWRRDGQPTLAAMGIDLSQVLPAATAVLKQHLAFLLTGGWGPLVAWWDTDGRDRFGQMKTWLETTLPAAGDVAVTAWGKFTGALEGLKRWWDGDGAAFRAGVQAWLERETDQWLTTAKRAWDGLQTKWGDLRAWWETGDGKRWSDGLATYWSETLWNAVGALQTKLGDLLAYLGGDFLAGIRQSVLGGAFKFIEDALGRVIQLVERAITLWRQLNRLAVGGGPTPAAPPAAPPAPAPEAAPPAPAAPAATATRYAETALARGFAAGARARGGDVLVNVTVEGNVTTERDLAERLRSLLLQTGRRNGFQGVLGGATG